MIGRIGAMMAMISLSLGAPATLASQHGHNEAAQYVSALCTLSGEWSGQFEQYDATGLLIREASFQASFDCQSEASLLSETNTFFQDDGTPFDTLKVIFPDGEENRLHMSYFYSQIEGIYFFKAELLDYKDDENWSIARESSTQDADVENAPTQSRYTHTRNGSELAMIREVNTGESQSDWVLSSKLLLHKQP